MYGQHVVSEEVVEDVPCAVLELSVVFCCTEEVKLQLYFAYSFLPFPSNISTSFCISFIYKPVSLSLRFLGMMLNLHLFDICTLCGVSFCIFILYEFTAGFTGLMYFFTLENISVYLLYRKMPKHYFFLP